MKIYTRSGDLGTTSLFGGQRVPKHHQRLNAYGTVDELNAALGWVVSLDPAAETIVKIQRVQSELMFLSSDLATPLDVKNALIQRMQAPEIRQLESEIDAWDAQLPSLKAFILPGGTQTSASLHMARTICRRAERAVVALAEQEAINEQVLRYLNRLSDWLFMLARWENYSKKNEDILWSNTPPASSY